MPHMLGCMARRLHYTSSTNNNTMNECHLRSVSMSVPFSSSNKHYFSLYKVLFLRFPTLIFSAAVFLRYDLIFS